MTPEPGDTNLRHRTGVVRWLNDWRWLISLVAGLVPPVVSVLNLVNRDALPLVASILAVIATIAIVAILLFLILSSRPSSILPGTGSIVVPKVKRYSSRLRWSAFALLVSLALAGICLLILNVVPLGRSVMTVAVAQFDGPDESQYALANTIAEKLRDQFRTDRTVHVVVLDRTVSAKSNDADWQQIAEAADASLLIWGWYSVIGTNVQVNTHIYLPDVQFGKLSPEPDTLDIGYHDLLETAHLNDFSFQLALGKLVTYATVATQAYIHVLDGDAASAVEVLTIYYEATRQNGDMQLLPVIAACRADAFYFSGDYKSAERDYTLFIESVQDGVRWSDYNGRGLCFVMLGRREEALADFAKAMSFAEAPLDARLNYVSAALDLGRLDEAEVALAELEPDEAETAPVYGLRGRLSDARGDFGSAVLYMQKAAQMDPETAGNHYNLGIALATQGQYHEAIASFSRAISIDDTRPEYRMLRGQVMEDIGDESDALRDYDYVIDNFSDPDFLALAYSRRGVIEAGNGQADDALLDLSTAIELDNQPIDRIYKALVLESIGRVDEAFGDLDRLLAEDPTNADVFRARALMHLDLGDFSSALTSADLAILADPDGQEHWLLRADIRAMMGDWEGAESDLQAAATKEPIERTRDLGHPEIMDPLDRGE